MPLQWRGHRFSKAVGSFFACCAGGALLPTPWAGHDCTPLFFFSLRKKKKSAVHGVEEKESLPRSVCPTTPTGAEHLSCTFHFSCGLRPKAVGAGKHCAPIVWHLSGQNLFVFTREMLSKSKAAMSAKVSRHSKFPLWRIFRMRLCSLSAAANRCKILANNPMLFHIFSLFCPIAEIAFQNLADIAG